MDSLYNMAGERLWPYDRAMRGEDIDAALGEVIVPDVPIEYMTDRQFIDYVDLLFAAYTNESF